MLRWHMKSPIKKDRKLSNDVAMFFFFCNKNATTYDYLIVRVEEKMLLFIICLHELIFKTTFWMAILKYRSTATKYLCITS